VPLAGLGNYSVGAFWRSDLALLRTTYYVGRNMSDARLLVLVSLSDGPRHGYSIQHDIEGFAGARLGAGTLYGAINTLERDQLIEPLPTTERRRPYRLTPAGRHHLRQQLELLDRIRARTAAVRLA
jgi:DNA-binding PadR family transcriptional regulator